MSEQELCPIRNMTKEELALTAVSQQNRIELNTGIGLPKSSVNNRKRWTPCNAVFFYVVM